MGAVASAAKKVIPAAIKVGKKYGGKAIKGVKDLGTKI